MSSAPSVPPSTTCIGLTSVSSPERVILPTVEVSPMMAVTYAALLIAFKTLLVSRELIDIVIERTVIVDDNIDIALGKNVRVIAV
jgi:hypothetical protein